MKEFERMGALHRNEEFSGAAEITFYDELEDSLTENTIKENLIRKKRSYDKQSKKINREKQEKHFENVKNVKTQVLVPLSKAIKKYKEQCLSLNQDSSIKRHILKYYKNILEFTKDNNRWYCSKEKLNNINFRLHLKNNNKD